MIILAIDPGSTQSGYVLRDTDSNKAAEQFGKVDNHEMLTFMRGYDFDHLVIEMVASYGMPVGATVFDTCVWIGRFIQCSRTYDAELPVTRVTRQEIKRLLCHTTVGVNDSVIKQRLIDIHAPGVRNFGKGTKAEPGFFYGFHADVWQAFAVSEAFLQRATAA